MKKSNVIILSIVSAFVAVLLAYLFFEVFFTKDAKKPFFVNRTETAEQIAAAVEPGVPTREYRNTAQNFSLSYPEDLSVDEYDEGGNMQTIVFIDEQKQKGFQIFFAPYLEKTITRERILKEIPSGKFTEPQGIMLPDGTKAIMFFSTVETGEMREVWFLHNSFLFQVTTWKELDNWLVEVMNTWQFF